MAVVHQALRFPGEDGGKSLSAMAQRDLDATLQLLAERAQYITGASGAAIALREGETMVCCASSGPSAPELGAHLQTDSGLSAESVRTRQILRCDDAENDPRVNRDSCRAFGIASVVVMPLVRGEEVYGVFELLSGRPRAFEERDFVALARLTEMIQTAVEHAEAARRAEKELGQPGIDGAVMSETGPELLAYQLGSSLAQTEEGTPETEPGTEAGSETEIRTETEYETGSEMATAAVARTPAINGPSDATPALVVIPSPGETTELAVDAHGQQAESELSAQITTIAFGNLRRCETCGFPVSEGRRLCLDCEAATPDADASVSNPSEFFGELDDSDPSWVRAHGYLIATALIAAATIALLLWRF
ncbi:MAG: GAF domain-containing protein [Terriglobales bacterium]